MEVCGESAEVVFCEEVESVQVATDAVVISILVLIKIKKIISPTQIKYVLSRLKHRKLRLCCLGQQLDRVNPGSVSPKPPHLTCCSGLSMVGDKCLHLDEADR